MATVQGLRATHGVGEGVMRVGNAVQDLGEGMEVAINVMDAVLDGEHLVLFWSLTSQRLCG